TVREVEIEPTFESWQEAARGLLREDAAPAEIAWREVPVDRASRPGGGGHGERVQPAAGVIRVPRSFVDLARGVAIHRDPARWALLYEVLWRLTREGRDLMERGDPSVERLARMEAEVRENRAVLTAGPFVPHGASLDELRAAATRCAGCDIGRHATQTVFGRGPADARIV